MFVVSLVVVFGALFGTASGAHYTEDARVQKHKWSDFKGKFNRKYSSTGEDAMRFSVFMENLKSADELQAANPQASFGVTKFSDLTADEFKEQYLTAKYVEDDLPATLSMPGVPQASCSYANDSVSWVGTQTTPIKDQGICGSCWSVCAAQQVESDLMRLYGSAEFSDPLSCQQFLDCDIDYPQSGCSGGLPYYAFVYLFSNLLETEATYPYVSGSNDSAQTCKYKRDRGVAGVTDLYTVSPDESCMAYYLQNYGTMSVTVNAAAWQFYTGGIMSAATCGSGVYNHAAQIVGLNVQAGYWILRNSWGASWGQDGGYIWLEFGTNCCNMTSTDPLVTDSYLEEQSSSSSGGSGKKDCFSGSEMITLEGGMDVPISEVAVGDRVLTWSTTATTSSGGGGGGSSHFTYSDVVFVPHEKNDDEAVFVEVSLESGRVIKMTPSHIIPAGDCSVSGHDDLPLHSAGELVAGLCVKSVSGLDKIVSAERVKGKGLYTLVTNEEFLVVNGVVASPFATNHYLVNKFYNIHRAVYAVFPSVLLAEESKHKIGEMTNYVGAAVLSALMLISK